MTCRPAGQIADAWHEDDVDPVGLADLKIVLEAAGSAVLARSELQRVDEDADHNHIAE